MNGLYPLQGRSSSHTRLYKHISDVISLSNKRKAVVKHNWLIVQIFIAHTGSGAYCWIAQRRALIFAFIVPVAITLSFNLVALTTTMLAIRKTFKVRVSSNKN